MASVVLVAVASAVAAEVLAELVAAQEPAAVAAAWVRLDLEGTGS